MKIVYMSDLHLEFGELNTALPCGDVLILDGDITLIGCLDRGSEIYHRTQRLRDRTMAFIEQCISGFERVFYVIGNHEAYSYDLSKAPRIIRSKMKGVQLLNDKAVDLGGKVMLVGGTLWTDMNKGLDAWQVGCGMNDFLGAIHIEDFQGTRTPGVYQARRFTTTDAMRRFVRTKGLIKRTALANPRATIVVATHHAPSIHGLNSQHVKFSRINAGYYTDLHAFIDGLPNIRWWIHGHTHLQKAYTIGECQVVSNARGYIGQEHSADIFNPDCWFDPVTGERQDPCVPVDEEMADA